MNTSHHGHATQRAIDGTARIITRAGTGADPHITATEIITALQGHGWRPTQAGTPPPWQPPPGHKPARGEDVTRLAAQARQAIKGDT